MEKSGLLGSNPFYSELRTSFTLVWVKAVCLYFCDDCSSTDPSRLGSFKWNEMHDSNPLLHQSFVCGSVGHSSDVKSL